MGRPSHAKEKLRQVASDLIWDNTYMLGLLLQARLRNDLNVLRDLQPTVITMVGAKQRVPSDFALSA